MMKATMNQSLPEDAMLYESDPANRLGGMISMAAVRGLIYRQRFILISIVAVALVLSLVITLLTRPIFEASTTVTIEPYTSNIVDGESLDPDLPANEIMRFLETQGMIIRSRRLAYQVVDANKLGDRADVVGELATVRPQGMSDAAWKTSKREAAAGVVMGGISVDVPMDNRIITVTYRSPDPQLSALIANSVATAFVQDDLRRSLERNSYAQGYLKQEIAKVQGQVQQAEVAANTYAKANGIISQSVQASDDEGAASAAPTITVGNLVSVSQGYTTARAKRIASEQRWLAIANVPAAQLPEVQQNGSIQSLLTERSKATAELSELRQRYGEAYPRVRELNAQINSLNGQITRSSADVKNAIRDEYLIAQRQEAALGGELGKVSGETMDEQDRRVRYNILDREASALRTQLASLLTRYNQISAAANLKTGSSSLLDLAQVPGGPVSPSLPKNLLIGLVLGAGLAFVIAILREAFDDRLRTTEDVETKLGLPLLGYTPDINSDDLAADANDPFSPLMEAYASIRTSIDFAVPGNNRVLQVTSSEPSEGKSLTASVIARKYAQLGRKTLLIDADLRKPSLFALFGAKRPTIGFVEVLLGDVPFESALLADTPDNLDVMPVGKVAASPVELLSSQVLIDFIEKYRQQYSLIIFDSAPVMGLADAPLLARLADATVFIVEANRAHFGQAKTAVRRLLSSGARIAGVVLTKYRAAEAGMAYDYHYQYYAYGEKKD